MKNVFACVSSVLFFSAALSAGPALAKDKLVDGSNEGQILSLLAELGFETSVSTSEEGVRVVAFDMDGVPITMHLNNCAGDRSCGVVTLTTGYDLENGIAVTELEPWNEGNLFGTAFVDEEADPYLSMSINLKYGVTEKNFKDTMDWWRAIKTEFEGFIGF